MVAVVSKRSQVVSAYLSKQIKNLSAESNSLFNTAYSIQPLQAGEQCNSGYRCDDNSSDGKCGIQKTGPVRLNPLHSHHTEEDGEECRQENEHKLLGEPTASRDEQNTYKSKDKRANGHRPGLGRHTGFRLL